MRVVAIIACRVSSTRLFCKPLQQVDKRTILELCILQLKKSNRINRIILAISNKPGNEVFVEFAKQHGLEFIRGDEEDVLKRIISGAKKANADIIFRVTSEDPFKHWKIIDKVITSHIDTSSDLTVTEGLPEGAGFEVVNLNSLQKSHQKGTKKEREHVTLYIYNHEKDFTVNRFPVEAKFHRPELRLTVDYPEDLILVRKIMAKLSQKHIPELEKVIKVLDENPELKDINKEFAS